ncbi:MULTISPECIES: hypothetical protein [unclassified Microbacterium]|uniref:hypothetical protein n=1 Tax=unclassified Microbacterium TaxID=2609290 RepID=UPI000EAA2295|nr:MULTISPECIES: hypothetical protein [unclassified Microbacterium]MBT2486282.1 hypothetical protein [Microbacterium sp. ISL-108]RKN68995.1 hypothetical protein D7252_16385 [Microbacterium sp. CGR2]
MRDANVLPPSGGHHIAARFSGTSPLASPPGPRRGRRTLISGIFGGVGLIAVVAITQTVASLGYDSAVTDYRAASAGASESQTQLRAENEDLVDASDAAEAIIAVENEAIPVAATQEEATSTAAGVAGEATAAADDLLGVDIPPVGDKPDWFWELFGATAQLDRHQAEVTRLSDAMDLAAVDTAEAFRGLTESTTSLLVSAGESAAGFEAAHVSARNEAIIALREAAADATATTSIDEGAAETYSALQDAAHQVIATERAELDEKAGPLLAQRLEIEEFARSLAPGVLLEFDWAPMVNGAGGNGSMGGYTTWWWDDPGRATIELSNSVAEQWPADRSKALVAHEVGHAISVKCEGMYDASTQDSIENWATAWAIGMGFTDDANGVWAYGYPPQNYIDAAAGCR